MSTEKLSNSATIKVLPESVCGSNNIYILNPNIYSITRVFTNDINLSNKLQECNLKESSILSSLKREFSL